ncbi:MAG TPA: PhzF family phenazine biosynthesis protein [Methylomirabilota bacterium]|nr:PhzF family phenazine biosynthesis protein [Methylomirabilota bacterium]
MSRAIPVLHVDVFTDRPFAGNPAAALLDTDGLTEAEMQRMAAEMGKAGTAFVSAPTRSDADRRLRMFSPTRELGYSGHTTIAAVHALREAGRLPEGRVTFETLSGLVRVEVEERDGEALIWLEPPRTALSPLRGPLPEILDVLGLPASRLGSWARPALTPDADVLLPAADLGTLRQLAPDMSRLGRLGDEHKLRGFCVVAPAGLEPASATHSRFFAPHYGVPEDIVTGSVHSAIGVWLLEAGRLRPDRGLAAFIAEQGDFLGRPGRVAVEVRVATGTDGRDRVAGVRVGGRAVTVLSGSLHLP